jgi:hypothetical protein
MTPTAEQYEQETGRLPTVMLLRDPKFARWVRSFNLTSPWRRERRLAFA